MLVFIYSLSRRIDTSFNIYLLTITEALIKIYMF